jgi:membrane protease YdiL (CAAX protease family)
LGAFVFVPALVLVALRVALSAPPDRVVDGVATATCVLAAQVAFLAGGTRAQRLVARDVAARPLLGSLPLSPADTLSGKARHLRRQLWPLGLPLLVVFAVARHPLATQASWRMVVVAFALALYAEAAVAVAFLSSGLGAPPSRQSLVSLETFLVAGPLLGALLAPDADQAFLSLGCLALVTWEARRAARRCLTWFDDPDEAGETAVWRALLVLAGFQAVQGLSGSLFVHWLAPASAESAAYGVSAIVLVFLTLRGRPPAEDRKVRSGFVAAGALAGAMTGAIGLGYLSLVDRAAAAAKVAEPATASFAAIAVIAAPLSEELFFRGWLQRSVAAELPARWVAWAPAIAAVAFAAVHPARSFVPVLLLGLVTGWLFARTKTVHAGVLAHTAHNAVVVGLPLALRFLG